MSKTFKQKLGQIIIPRLPVTRELFNQLRFELTANMIKIKRKLDIGYRYQLKKINKQKDISLNVGAGPFGENGWINLDLSKYKNVTFVYDCRKQLPFSDESVLRIRCEHFFEHLDRGEHTVPFLSECLRVLKPGGVLRIVVPDLELFIKTYIQNTAEGWKKMGFDFLDPKQRFNTPIELLNHTFRQDGEHKFGYDYYTIEIDLLKAGFSKVSKMEWGESTDPMLQNDLSNHKPYSLYVDCIK